MKGISGFLIILCGAFMLQACGEKSSVVYDLARLESPILFAGDSVTGYRDPAILYHEGRMYLFFTKSEIVDDKIYWYTVQSESDDLVNWTTPRQITPNSQDKNYSNPGSVVQLGDEWILCLQSYPRPGYTADQMPLYGNEDSRTFVIRSSDLHNWSEPELMKVKGDIPEESMGRVTNPYIIKDKDDKDKWWCFYKQAGVNMSYSYDLRNWTPSGVLRTGENVSVIVSNDEYVMFNAPRNGINVLKSRTLKDWANWGGNITLGQEEWEWAKGRVTSGNVVYLPKVKGINGYLMFYHASGPLTEFEGDFDKNCSIGIAWSKDLLNWDYPGKK